MTDGGGGNACPRHLPPTVLIGGVESGGQEVCAGTTGLDARERRRDKNRCFGNDVIENVEKKRARHSNGIGGRRFLFLVGTRREAHGRPFIRVNERQAVFGNGVFVKQGIDGKHPG